MSRIENREYSQSGRGSPALIEDDLTAPLGQDPVSGHSLRNKTMTAAAILGAIGLFAVSGIYLPGWIIGPDPAAQSARVLPALDADNVEPQPGKTAAQLAQQFRAAQEAAAEAWKIPPFQEQPPDPAHASAKPGIEEIGAPGGVKIVRPGAAGASGPLVINIAKELNRGIASTPDPRLLEQSRYGPIPRMGADGARPSRIYARPSYSPAGQANSPRIVLVVGGMGLASRITESAISALPPEVTLAFAPYGQNIGRLTERAREAGHEILLQVPMEPFDSRDNPGPRTLLAGAGKAANLDNLAWLMSRFTGYIGIMNFLGGKFTGDEKALMPVLRETAARGLLYLDDGSSAHANATALAPNAGLAAARADVVLDSAPQQDAVEAALKRLEAIAREKGTAIGVASALPALITAVGRFARALQSQGFSLIPLSAAVAGQQGAVADSLPVR